MHNTSYHEQDFTNQTPSQQFLTRISMVLLYSGCGQKQIIQNSEITHCNIIFILLTLYWCLTKDGSLECNTVFYSCWFSLHGVTAHLHKVNLLSTLLCCWTWRHPVTDAYAARNNQDSLKVNEFWSRCHCRLMSM